MAAILVFLVVNPLYQLIDTSLRDADTGALESTQVSLLPPPRCMESTRESGPLATLVSPPGMTM